MRREGKRMKNTKEIHIKVGGKRENNRMGESWKGRIRLRKKRR